MKPLYLHIIRPVAVPVVPVARLLLRLHARDLMGMLLVARVPGLAVLGVVARGVGQGQRVVGVRALGAVALAQLVRRGMGGQGVGVVHLGRLAAPEAAEEAGLGVARGVVVGGRGAEALLLLAVAAERELGDG